MIGRSAALNESGAYYDNLDGLDTALELVEGIQVTMN